MAALYKEQLGKLIAERRIALGLTQAELADAIPVKESQTISRWERGERAPNDLEAVARALQTTASDMLAQLAPLHQKQRRPLDLGGGTQLDRIERKLDDLLNRLPSDVAELLQTLAGVVPPGEHTESGRPSAPRGPGRRRRAS